MNTVQYVGLLALAGFWATVSAGFMLHSAELEVRAVCKVTARQRHYVA